MEEKQVISEELEQRILSATTAEELLALAAESGEKLTLKEAQALLEQLQSASSHSDHLSDEELGKVSGGWFDANTDHGTTQKPVSEMTERDGNNVYIYFSARGSHCKYWKCREHNSTFNNYSGSIECIVCRQEAFCSICIHRQAQGWVFTHDYCTCPDVRASHGL